VLTDLSPLARAGLRNLGALGGQRFAGAPDAACRPFDGDAEGFIPGQGAGCVILETAESCRRREQPALAELAGGALVLDGSAGTAPDAAGEARAMRLCLERAGVAAAAVDYVNAHGTSTPLGDRVELAAIGAVLGARLPEVWINATKGLTGHCLFAAG